MQMEPWRKRGFVPDSDEEDDFDSLNTSKPAVDDANDDVDLDYIPIPTIISKPEEDAAEDQHSELSDPAARSDDNHDDGVVEGSQELVDLVLCPPSKNGLFRSQELRSAAPRMEQSVLQQLLP
ncbi:uncharacterized protein N7482_004135 [Penicillium canariense]|uniref:Uncharacterized protein n=1 Tax=Penicillium canariense TaxID=189055 RepID=A0A9W9I816_9EURO|nr:uncharacterized protein N7482_004135 [Penicillium canariense]KAJ5168541.1 hypothetical protein N7482_004135 [Penicillium canariense]